MTNEERAVLLKGLERFWRNDSLLALELLSLQGVNYPEMAELSKLLYQMHLCLAALRMRLMGFDVRTLPHGYIFAPPKMEG
jgi:hypothetical protein